QLSAPVDVQPSTYVAVTASGGFDEAWSTAPPAAAAASRWRRKHLVSGHWPMVSDLDATVDLLEAEIRHYTRTGAESWRSQDDPVARSPSPLSSSATGGLC